tara:strand:+ start:1264 stop:1437 length:174 start_codon:yes stop_codon:yes gene_type:complete
MLELLKPIEKQIMMCDTREETLMLACAMLHKAQVIIEAHLGENGRKEIFTFPKENKR